MDLSLQLMPPAAALQVQMVPAAGSAQKQATFNVLM